MKAKIVLIGGGVRSGKSSLAVRLGLALGERRAFVATATRSDGEMGARIDRHQLDRGDAWQTFEVPLELASALESFSEPDIVVIDCLTHWLSNLLIRKMPGAEILSHVDRVVAALERRRFHAVLVTNEVGMSVHPETALGRAFVEICGFAHQRIARAADEVHLAVLGTSLQIKPPPALSSGESRA